MFRISESLNDFNTLKFIIHTLIIHENSISSSSPGVKHGLRVIRCNWVHTKCFCTFYIQTFSRFRNWMMPLWHP